MKFNFEKIKENTKKIVMGAGVLASSYGNLEAEDAKPKNTEQNKMEVVKNKNGDDNKESTNRNNELQKKKVLDQAKINQLEKDLGIFNDDDNSSKTDTYRNKYQAYMEHPSYKDRLSKEIYGDKILDEEMKENLNQEYQDRLDQLKNVSIHLDNNSHTSEFTSKNNQINSSENVIFHELSHAVENNRHNSRSFEVKVIEFKLEGKLMTEKNRLIEEKKSALNKMMTPEIYEKTHEEFISILKNLIANNKNNIEIKTENIDKKLNNFFESKIFTVSDYLEYFKLSKNGPSFKMNLSNDQQSYTLKEDIMGVKESIPKIHSDFIKKNLGLMEKLTSYESVQNYYDKKIGPIVKDLFYLKNGTEIRARLNHLRIKAIENYNFDLKDDFDINNFEKLKGDPQYNDLKVNLGFSDEQINELMKNTASIEEKIENKDGNFYHPGFNYGEENSNQA